jgi:hypothetical protein
MTKLTWKEWHNITYPTIGGKLPEWLYRWWEKKRCSKNHHLFDEVMSDKQHYLSCDACGLAVPLGKSRKYKIEQKNCPKDKNE